MAKKISSIPVTVSVIAKSTIQLTLISTVGGTDLPFAVGQVFSKGQFPAGSIITTNESKVQVTAISTWDDSSIKHASVAGLITLTANVSKPLLFNVGTAPVGILSESNLVAASPKASITYGTMGTVDLASLIATQAPIVKDHAGPYYVAFQYMSAFPNAPTVNAIFYVQLWSNNRYRVRVSVENARPSQQGTEVLPSSAAVSVNNVSIYNNNIAMPKGIRWDVVSFAGTDPQVTPQHDIVYLKATKLFPNFGWKPTEDLLASTVVPYNPGDRLDWEQNMGATGFSYGIGLLPQSDVLYIQSADRRAWQGMLDAARAYGVFSLYFRDPTTKRLPLPSKWPNAWSGTDDPNGSSERMTGLGTNTNEWEFAHHPNACYSPWLLTAERFYLEGIQANAWASYYTVSPNRGQGTARQVADSSQVRGTAWRYRTIALLAGISPDLEPGKSDWRDLAYSTLLKINTDYVTPNSPGTGLGYLFDDQDPAAGWQRSLFENMFRTSAVGFTWDVELGLTAAQKNIHKAVRDYFYKAPVGMCGRGPALGEFSYRMAPGPYRTTIGPADGTAYNTWGEVFTATYGTGFTANFFNDGQSLLSITDPNGTGYVDDPSPVAFPESNYGHVLTALAYAVDHGATGALAAYTRLTTATNWKANSDKFVNRPQYGVVKRN